jgi:hypothetical protein
MLVCNLLVVVMVHFTKNGPPVGIESKAQVEGKMLAQDDSHYLIDFSKDAKKHNYNGDYSKVLVFKNECIKE